MDSTDGSQAPEDRDDCGLPVRLYDPDAMREAFGDDDAFVGSSPHGSTAMASRLVGVTSSMRHFSAATGIVERAVLQSEMTGRPLAMPPILMVSSPGLGKTFYC